MDARAMRQGNLSLVLGTVLREAPISQPQIVELTGLKKPTVSNLLDELVRLGWVRVEGALRTGVGRPRQLLVPNAARGIVLSLRISVSGVSALAVDFGASAPRAETSLAVDVRELAQSGVIEALGHAVRAMLGDLGDPSDIVGTALALPGVVGNDGRLGYAPGLAWPDADAGELVRRELPGAASTWAPLVVENEANLAAVAEQRYGCAAGTDNFLFLLAESGLGAGVVLGGRLFRGTRGAGGEVGHQSIDLDGPRCPCGKRGCWALYVGQDTLVATAKTLRRAGRRSSLWPENPASPRSGPRLTRDAVFSAAASGDRVATEIVTDLRRHVAAGIGNLVSCYDPELVVLGGHLADVFRERLPALRLEVDDWLMGADGYADLRLEASTIDDAPLWGGVALVHDSLVRDPRLVG